MKFLGTSPPRPLRSPGRVIMLVCAVLFWLANILLLFNHRIAVLNLAATAPGYAPNGIVYQSTDYSCGPASLAMIFRHYNIIRSERDWGELAGTNLSVGTTLSGLKKAGESMGFEPVEMNPDYEQLDLIAYPSIIFQSRAYHLVTFWGLDSQGNAIIRDPARGRIVWNRDEYDFNTPDEPTMLVLYPGKVPTCTPDSPAIEIGRIENMLSKLGYYHSVVTGDWSPKLSNAIGRFQGKMGLERTGYVDQETSIYIDGAWRLFTSGPIPPFMHFDRQVGSPQRQTPILSVIAGDTE